MKNNTFDGTGTVRVFYFIDRSVKEAEMLNMSEAQ